MLSIGKFAELAQVSARTVRFYESIGLLPSSIRQENNYRYYDKKYLERMEQIRDLQSLGFSLEEIKSILLIKSSDLKSHFQQRLNEIDLKLKNLHSTQVRLKKLLSVSKKIDSIETVNDKERNLFMEAIKEKIIESMKTKYPKLTDSELAYLDRDSWIYNKPHINEFVEAVKKCVQFAKDRKLKLGPGRGSSPASISLFGLGFSSIDPMKHGMIPERLNSQSPNLHIDVEFERGQEFVDYCREINKELSYGEIHAFKMPLIDIIQNVHKQIGHVIDYNSIDNNSEIVLNPFKMLQIEKVFQFDFSSDALIMKYEGWFPEYQGLGKIKEYLQKAPVRSFRDIINITAVWRPNSIEMIERIEAYSNAKTQSAQYSFLPKLLKQQLNENFGLILYHEDLIRIIQYYTKWDLGRCNLLRQFCFRQTTLNSKIGNLDWQEFCSTAPPNVTDLVAEESKWTFCLPHSIAFSEFTKRSAILKSLHLNEYLNQIEIFEQKFGFRWDDIGIKIKGVSLLQS